MRGEGAVRAGRKEGTGGDVRRKTSINTQSMCMTNVFAF